MYDAYLIASIAVTLGVMALGMKLFGLGGGFAGFFIGAIMSGVIAANIGVEMDGAGCQRYSSIAQDC